MQIAQNQPINRAFLALNYYISTGDHVGEGVAWVKGERTQIGVPVNRTDARDIADWECLHARLGQIKADGFDVIVTNQNDARAFTIWQIDVATADLDAFAELLKAEAGPLGWGSMKQFLEQHGIE